MAPPGGTSFFANLMNTLIGGTQPRTYSEDDFARWYSTLQPPVPTLVGEALPPGVPTMASRYGVFGSKALTRGVPGDENYTPPACVDAEAKPPAPCEATGECQDLQDLATRFERGSDIARALAVNAISAIQVAQVLLKRVEKAAANLVRMPELSHLSASEPNGPGGEPWSVEDMITLNIRGPLLHGDRTAGAEIDDSYLTRLMDRWDFEHRTVEYLNRTDGNRPLQLIENLGRMPIHEPMPEPTPIREYDTVRNPTMQNPLTMLQMPAAAVIAMACQIKDTSVDRHQRYCDFLL